MSNVNLMLLSLLKYIICLQSELNTMDEPDWSSFLIPKKESPANCFQSSVIPYFSQISSMERSKQEFFRFRTKNKSAFGKFPGLSGWRQRIFSFLFLFSERVRSSSLGCFELWPRLQGQSPRPHLYWPLGKETKDISWWRSETTVSDSPELTWDSTFEKNSITPELWEHKCFITSETCTYILSPVLWHHQTQDSWMILWKWMRDSV